MRRELVWLGLTIVALIVGFALQVMDTGGLHLMGWGLAGAASILLVIQILSMTSDNEKPSGLPGASQLGKNPEQRRDKDPPRRI